MRRKPPEPFETWPPVFVFGFAAVGGVVGLVLYVLVFLGVLPR